MPQTYCHTILLSDTEIAAVRLPLQAILEMHGFAMDQPYRIQAVGNGMHRVYQDSLVLEEDTDG